MPSGVSKAQPGAQPVTPPSQAAATEPAPLAELRSELATRYARRFGALSAELLVQHVLDTAQTSDPAVLEAALAALARRWEFAREDELGVNKRPPPGQILGSYTTARAPAKGKRGAKKQQVRRVAQRPYTSHLEGLNPLRVAATARTSCAVHLDSASTCWS